MARALVPVSAADPAAVLFSLRRALAGGGPAVLPREAVPAGAGRAALAAVDAARVDDLFVPDDVALVIETSGSTGAPKRVALSGDALLASAAASASALDGQGGWLLALPAHYVAGINVLVRSIAARTEPVILPPGHFDPAAFAAATRELTGDARFTSLVPVQLARLLEAAAESPALLDSLRSYDGILVGGQALEPGLRERALADGLAVTRTYGSSETCGGCVYDGTPIGSVRAREVDGRIELAGPVLADGYLDDPARTANAFHEHGGLRWYRTGDLGTVGVDGRVTVHGRADNVIISGGEKVSLDAVERRVRQFPGFGDAVVLAEQSEEWGQTPTVVAARATTGTDVRGASADDLAGLRAHVRDALGGAAAPARIVVIERIPLLAAGKPDRVALNRIVSQGAGDRHFPGRDRSES